MRLHLNSTDVSFLAYSNHGLYSVRFGDVADAWLVEASACENDEPIVTMHENLWEALDEMAFRSNVNSLDFVIVHQLDLTPSLADELSKQMTI